MWQKVDKHHIKNGDWTICKNGIRTPIYGLWHNDKNHGWFKELELAKQHYERMNK